MACLWVTIAFEEKGEETEGNNWSAKPRLAYVYARRLNVLLEASEIHGDVAEEWHEQVCFLIQHPYPVEVFTAMILLWLNRAQMSRS